MRLRLDTASFVPIALVALLGFVIVASFVTYVTDPWPHGAAAGFVGTVFPPVIVLVACATSFAMARGQ